MLDHLVRKLALGWDGYRATGRVSAKDPIHSIVLQEIPSILREWHGPNRQYLVKGSDGQGNLNRTPWIATFNTEVTTSAEKGYYLVYLFQDNFESMVLELGFGATQFEQKYGRGKLFFDEVQSAVNKMRTASSHLLNLLEPTTRDKVSNKPTVLNSGSDFKLKAYEMCSVYSITYSLVDMINDETLKNDYQQMLRLYDAMVESPTLPSEEAYVVDNSTTPEVPDQIDIEPFLPKKKVRRKIDGYQSKGSNQKRYSKSSDKVGKIGEEYVFNVEKETLRRGGRRDLADKVIWHRHFPSDRTPGWDITSYDLNGQIKLIEVKASMGKQISNVDLTRKEWEQASASANAGRYNIYFVTSALTKPKIRVLCDPAIWVENGYLDLQIERFTLNISEN